MKDAAARLRRRLDPLSLILWLFSGLVLAFLLAPIVVLLLTSFTASETVEFPPAGFSLRWYRKLIDTFAGASGTQAGLAASFWFSVELALLTAAVSIVCGVLAALALHRYRFPGKQAFDSLILLPLTFPQLIIGVALLLIFSELHLFGSHWFLRLLIGHVVITLPYIVLTVRASLAVYEQQLEDAARSLGAGPVRTFWHITLPLIRPGIFAGGLFVFITSLTQFTVSYFLSFGVSPLPIWLYHLISQGHDPLLAALSVFLIALTVAALLVLQRLVGVGSMFGGGQR